MFNRFKKSNLLVGLLRGIHGIYAVLERYIFEEGSVYKSFSG